MKISIDNSGRVVLENPSEILEPHERIGTLNSQQSECFWKLMHEGGASKRAGVLLSFWEMAAI